MKKVCLLTMLLLLYGCSTDTYYKDRSTRVTVKKFIGIPYLETEEHTTKRPAGVPSSQ